MDPNFCENWKAAEASAALERNNSLGDLYFIRAGDAVKIGRSVNLTTRMKKMQVDNPEKLDCVLVLKGCGPEEGKWHKTFAADHIRGEWFRFSPSIQNEVERLSSDWRLRLGLVQ